MNQSYHVRDLVLDNIIILDNPNAAVVAVIPPTLEKVATPEEAAAAAATPAEPEVIKKGKEDKDEESDEPADKAKKGNLPFLPRECRFIGRIIWFTKGNRQQ